MRRRSRIPRRVVLARTRAEARALSWLMRERVLTRTPETKRTVIEVSRDLDGRMTEPLEIAVGDRLRIGATQWEKQLFNGTVVTVEDLEVRHGEQASAERNKAKQRRDEADAKTREHGMPSVRITARTDDGRRVTFRHDEIRDYKDNVRLDYGYAMTIASAQGLTVDRAFLLVDDRPARETIYPAATRHREGIDVYVNRSPLAFDIADRRPEDQADMPVTDSDVRAYLAERWSRSQPKEAALDYTTDGEWRDPREEKRHGPGPGEGRGEPAEALAAANENAIVRIAREIRYAVNGWRHGAAVDAFAAERVEVLAAWDELRERTRDEGEAVALSPAFRETIERHGALMKQAAMFRGKSQVLQRLLAERAGIGEGEIEELRDQHARAGKYLRSVAGKAAHAARQDAEPEETGVVKTIALGTTAPAPDPPVERHAPPRPAEAVTPNQERVTTPDWPVLYRGLQRDWNDLVARADEPDLPLPLMDGYDALIPRVRALAARPDLTERARDVLEGLLKYHDNETVARQTAEDYLASVERHVQTYKALERQAEDRAVSITELADWPKWREAAEMLAATGRAILTNEERYGPYLDTMTIGKARGRLSVEQLRNRLRAGPFESPTSEPEAQEPKPQRQPAPKREEEGFAHILDDPEKLRELREKAEQQDRKRGKHQRRSRGLSM